MQVINGPEAIRARSFNKKCFDKLGMTAASFSLGRGDFARTFRYTG